MKIRCTVAIDYSDRKKTEAILHSTEVDNLGFIHSWTDGNKLKAVIEADSVSSLIHTLDDYLACVSVAEKVIDKS
jgi:tRNA threonylcarbamoyladenosine modification (KEOPS) complex  Pcc1 subunit